MACVLLLQGLAGSLRLTLINYITYITFLLLTLVCSLWNIMIGMGM